MPSVLSWSLHTPIGATFEYHNGLCGCGTARLCVRRSLSAAGPCRSSMNSSYMCTCVMSRGSTHCRKGGNMHWHEPRSQSGQGQARS